MTYRVTGKWIARPAASAALRYGLAFASIAAALGLAHTFLYFHLPQPFAAFALSAIAITFWYGGTKPGIVAAVLASIVRYFHWSEVGAVSRVLYDLVFVIFALLMIGVNRARSELEVRVAQRTAELTRANEDLSLEIAERKRAEEKLRQSEAYLAEAQKLTHTGSWTVKHLHTVGHPVLDASGNLVQFVGSSTDITERKQAEEALRQAQSDLAHVSRVTTMGELTASLAHEVNQPIAAAITDANTCLRWLNRDHPDVEEAREAASRMVKDATRAAEIVSRTRLLFKKGTPQWELVDINEIIREMVALMRSEVTRHSISVRTELAEDVPQLTGDRVQLQQVLMNLMINAIDAMKDGDGTRELAVKSQRAENEQLMVSISDTGVGLPPQQADQIFNAFFTTKPHGTGMGLRISRSIIESHGGRLWAADNSPRGASFHLTLPVEAEAHE